MADALSLFKDFTPSAYGIWVGVLMFIIYFIREWRETRKLSFDDRQARREGYAAQVESLMLENRALRQELHDSRVEHNDYRSLCQAETDQLRATIRKVQDELSGIKRAVAAGAQAAFNVMPTEMVPLATQAAAERAAEYIIEKENNK